MWPAPSSPLRMSVAWSASSSRYAMRIGLRRGPLRAPRAELLEELLALLARRGDVALLDVAEAADLLGEGGELDCGGVILRVEAGEELLDCLLVLPDQLALHAPLFGMAEGIKRGSSEESQPRKELENSPHPSAETHLARLAAERIDLRKKRWREVVIGPVVAFEHVGDLLFEFAVGVQARNLVLVLVGEELVVIARDRFGELRGAGLVLFDPKDAADQGPVSGGISGVLIVGEELRAPLDQLVQAAREVLVDRDDGGRRGDAADLLLVGRGAPAPEEALLVELHRDAIQFDCALQRLASERNPALLIGIAEHEHVGRDG